MTMQRVSTRAITSKSVASVRAIKKEDTPTNTYPGMRSWRLGNFLTVIRANDVARIHPTAIKLVERVGVKAWLWFYDM